VSNFTGLKRFKDIPIASKLYFTVGIMALLIAIELLTLWFAITTLSSVRAFVAGEGLWSKAQKDASYHLRKYGRTHNEQEYLKFQEFIKVPLGDHKTLVELGKPNPDMAIARQGFIEGRNHRNDVDGMIKLFTRFHDIYYIKKAIEIWSQADMQIPPLIKLAEALHAEISADVNTQRRIDELLNQVDEINEKLTVLEDNFSYTLGEGSRWLENLVLTLLFLVVLTVEVTGLLLTISVSRGIQKGLDEILNASQNIAKGNLSARARAYSKDEIGQLANSFNKMAEELGESIKAQQKTEELLKDYARKLERSNDNLEQFAYVASHDLQEPLRTITNFARLLEEKQKDSFDATSRKYMNYVVNAAGRLKTLISDLLHFSRIGKQPALEKVNTEELVAEVIMDMSLFIRENKAEVRVGSLPVLRQSSKVELKLLFQNLLNNAIKYRQQDVLPVVKINAERRANGGWLFSVRDNGIGIDPEFREKIFIIFQRLHSENDYSGTGIGLATCKKIVELAGGTIWVESKPSEGSTFYFTVPNT
jgi:two-component system, sensor histidine kinase